jgi:tetratricopeptide (TPR) repeat protein
MQIVEKITCGRKGISRVKRVLTVWLILVSTASAQGPDYRDLWRSGQYAEATAALEARFDQLSYRPRSMRADYAELLFVVGRTGDAIAILEGLAMSATDPAALVRLAQMVHYRGRMTDFDGIIGLAQRQIQSLSNYQRGRDDLLAEGQLKVLKGEDPREIMRHFSALTRIFPDYTAAFVASGDLALSKRAYDVAERAYQKALGAEPDNQDALSGLATCYQASGDPRADEVMATLNAANPNHPGMRLLRAERLLDLGEADAAMTVLDSVTAINPHHLDALALKAACGFLKGDTLLVERLHEAMFAINPVFSGAFRVPGKIASRHYRFHEGQAFQRKALDMDASDQEARLLLAFDLLRLGQDTEARAELDGVFSADPFSVRAYNLLEASDAIRDFRTIDHGIFRLQLPEYEAQVMTGEILSLLDQAAATYQEKYRIDLKSPVVVQVFENHDLFMVRSVGLPGSAGHMGICFGQLITMDSPRARPLGTMNWRQVLWHEFAHVITLQKTNNRMQRWLSEGISVYEETTGDPSWGQRLDLSFKPVVEAEGYPDIADLNRYFTAPKSSSQLMFGYFSAGEFVKFYVGAYGQDALEKALRRIGEGQKTSEALVAESKETLAEINLRFDAHLRVRCAPLYQLGEHSVFSMLVADGDAAARRGDLAAAERAFVSAFEAFPDYAAEDAPLRRLVTLYADSDDRAGYRRCLNRLVAWDPTAHEACVTLASILIEDGDAPAAIFALNRAFSVHPFHVRMLKSRALAAQQNGDWPLAEDDLKRLMFLDLPGRPDHQLNLARLLVKQGRRQAARAEVLALLESLPNFWDAQELLLDLVEGGP